MNLGRIPAKTALLDPEREALIDIPNDRRMTFGALDERVRRLANAFCDELKLNKGDRVAILSKNCIQYMEVFYACARCGLIAQPLNWRLSEPEMARILEDGEPAVLIGSEEYAELTGSLAKATNTPATLVFTTAANCDYEQLIAAASDAEPAASAGVTRDDPVLILYTGGTTGESKGALHSHHSLYMGMLNQSIAERIVPTDVYMLTGQMFHIPVALAMNYMAHGCPVVLINFDAKLALDVIQQERVSAFLGITTMINWMMAVEGFEDYDLSSLRNFQYGGGPMPRSVVEAALEAFPCTMIQGYGQTEGMTMTFLSQEDHQRAVTGDHPERLGSCGREGFVSEIRVVNPEGEPVPRDGQTAGEIAVRSEANMLGYWRRPDLTEQTIRGDWMWTGDIATWDEEGYVFIVDRAKDMIISGGFNIYPRDLEDALLKQPEVVDAAVIGIPSKEWGETPLGFVVAAGGETLDLAAVCVRANAELGKTQRISALKQLDELPRSHIGKILKTALREMVSET